MTINSRQKWQKKKKLATLIVGSTLTSEKFESFLLKKIKYYS